MKYEALVIGTSAGGLEALKVVLGDLPKGLSFPIIVVMHIAEKGNGIIGVIERISGCRVKEIEDKEAIMPGIIYFAPSMYHTLIEDDRTFSFSTEGKVNFS